MKQVRWKAWTLLVLSFGLAVPVQAQVRNVESGPANQPQSQPLAERPAAPSQESMQSRRGFSGVGVEFESHCSGAVVGDDGGQRRGIALETGAEV